MDSSSGYPVSRSPRRELQGPRPTPLKVRKDSYKIRKPPVAPTQQQQQQHSQQQQQQQHHNHHQQQQQHQPRAPVIIYTVSPKVIHTNPGDFMSLVQRLTGSSSSSSTTTTTTTTSTSSNHQMNDHFHHDCGAISPAARYASIEKIKSSPREAKRQHHHHHHHHQQQQQQQSHEEDNIIETVVAGVDMGQLMDNINKTGCLFPGILSPGPNSLPPISPNLFFSPPSDPPPPPPHHNSVSFFHDLSPVLYGNRTFMEGSFMPSPSASSFVSPYNIISPTTPSLDLFNNFFDF